MFCAPPVVVTGSGAAVLSGSELIDLFPVEVSCGRCVSTVVGRPPGAYSAPRGPDCRSDY